MAIDTRQKRFSMLNFGEGDAVLFEADGTVDLDDKQHLLGLYSGIAFAGPAVSVLASYASNRSRIMTLTRGP